MKKKPDSLHCHFGGVEIDISAETRIMFRKFVRYCILIIGVISLIALCCVIIESILAAGSAKIAVILAVISLLSLIRVRKN